MYTICIAYFMSIVSTSFWVLIWIMHLCALTNAKLKLHKKHYQIQQYSPPSYSFHITTTTATVNTPPDDNHIHIRSNDIKTNRARDLSANFRHPGYGHHHHHNQLTTTASSPGECDKKATGNLMEQFMPPSQHPSSPPPMATATLTTTGSSVNHANIDNTSTLKGHPNHGMINNNHIDLSPSRNKRFTSYINLPLPGVSILKPLVGVDKNLHHNLETFFLMDYPNYELLFCVQDPHDVAILVVEELFKKYPQADARLFVGGQRVGVNPKINNMQPAYEASKYEFLLISDSAIAMGPDTLLDMVSHMQDNVALVHQMPFVSSSGSSFQSNVERVYFGTAHARAYLTADLLSIDCPTGMSALMRKCLLDEVGGIKAFGKYLAEDYFFAKSFTNRGWKISISSQPAIQNSANSSDTLNTLRSRIQRWIKLRFAMVPQWTLLEPFSECMLLGVLGALSISFLWALNAYAIFVVHVLVWFVLDYKLLCTIQNGPLSCSKLEFTLAWLTRECTALLIFLNALLDSKVTWRSRQFRLKWGGHAEEVQANDGETKDEFEAKNDHTTKSNHQQLVSPVTTLPQKSAHNGYSCLYIHFLDLLN